MLRQRLLSLTSQDLVEVSHSVAEEMLRREMVATEYGRLIKGS